MKFFKNSYWKGVEGYLNSFVSYLFAKRTVFLIISLFAASLLRSLLRVKFDDWLVKPVFAAVSSTVLNDLLIAVSLLFFLIVLARYARKQRLLHPDWIVLSVFAAVIYSFVRNRGWYSFSSFHFFASFYYADSIFLLGLAILSLQFSGLWRARRKSGYQDTPFLVDLPISEGRADLLNRQQFAHRIAAKIQSKPSVENAGALAIGITGEWGAGKTSFSNIIAEALDHENRIIITFNPWRSSSTQKIIEDFFELLIAELKKYDATLSANIYSYAKTLTKIDQNTVTKVLEALGDLFQETNKNEAYQAVNRSISAINKQLIIFIDDLDRLDKAEIIEVLRIIRNTANFNNVVYIVSYDKGYVLEAVKSFNEFNYQAFLEKIFQFEFALPMYEPGIIRNYLKGLLEAGLTEALHDQISAVVDASFHKGINFTNEIIRTHREAIRLANSVLFEISGLEHDVFFYDFYLLQLLKLQYPFVYRGLIEHKALFFVNDPQENDKYLRLRLENERALDTNTLSLMRAFNLGSDNNRPVTDKQEPIFHQYLRSNQAKFALSDLDVLLLQELMAELLESERQINKSYPNDRYKAFYRSDNFHKYFAFELREGEIPALDFENARRGDFDAYTAKVNEWIADGKWPAFQDRLLKIEDFSDRHEFENHVRALFETGRVLVKEDNPYMFNYKHLIHILAYPTAVRPGEPLRIYENLETYQAFLRSLLQQEGDDKRFESRLLQMIIDYEQTFALPFAELSQTVLGYLQAHLNCEGPLDDNFWVVLRSSRVRTEDGYRGTVNQEAQELGKAYYLTHVTACGLGSFIHQIQPESKYYYFQHDLWTEYFTSLDELRQWAETAEQLDRDSDCYREFNSFFEASAAVAFQGVEWEFMFLTPVRWRSH